MTVGERIAELRKERGFSQAKLANQAGLSPSAIAMYETNRRSPDDDTVVRLAKALDVSEASLTDEAVIALTDREEGDRDGVPQTSSSGADLTLQVSPDEARVLLAMRMSPGIAKFLLSYVTASDDHRSRLERTWEVIHAFEAVQK